MIHTAPNILFWQKEEECVGTGRSLLDLLLILLVAVCVIAISAHAPSTLYANSQLKQAGAVIGTIQQNEWILPRNQYDEPARKPQLYAWLDAPVLMLTGVYSDFTYCMPTMVAFLLSAMGVYFLGRRWYGRRAGLWSALLWLSIFHMGKMSYVVLTDMLLNLSIFAVIFCADKLLFHPAPKEKQLRWVIAFWATMTLGALTKGWGILNLTLVGLILGLATAVLPGFEEMRPEEGFNARSRRWFGLIGQRWWGAMKATRFFPGMAAMLLVIVPIWIAMFTRGGSDFSEIVHYELWARVTGQGEDVPHSSSMPTIMHLLYYMLPVTVFSAGAMILTPIRQWFRAGSPIALPLCWMISIVVPFSFTHGFRHDYLLPAYAGGALMGGWAVDAVFRRGRSGGEEAAFVRHLFAATAVVIFLFLIVWGGTLVTYEHAPRLLTKNINWPITMERADTGWIILGIVLFSFVGLALAVWCSLKWRIQSLTGLVVVGMLGVIFIERHSISRHAVYGDGDLMMEFGREAGRMIGEDDFSLVRAKKLGTEVYIGRFGNNIARRKEIFDYLQEHEVRIPPGLDQQQEIAWMAMTRLKDSGDKWLVVCDVGTVEIGLAEEIPGGLYRLPIGKVSRSFQPRPERIGEVVLKTPRPIRSQQQGNIYLIKVAPEMLDQWFQEEYYLEAQQVEHYSGREGSNY